MAEQERIHGVPKDFLVGRLKAADIYAKWDVLGKNSTAGPFGASLDIYVKETGEHIFIAVDHNRVVEKSDPGAHAEDQVIRSSVFTLRKQLRRIKDEGNTPVVILSSSGESCDNCRSKEEILARTLIAEGLLEKGNFLVTYGATYDDTYNVAGFYDKPYATDFRRPMNEAQLPVLTVKMDDFIDQVREDLEILLRQGDEEHAVSILYNPLTQEAVFTSLQSNVTKSYNILKTPETSVVTDSLGVCEKFALPEGHVLITTNQNIGPMARATAQWANVSAIITLADEGLRHLGTNEAPGISNADFMRVIQAPYNSADSAITIVHLPDGFENKAQHAFADKVVKIVYNGSDAEADLHADRIEVVNWLLHKDARIRL